MELTQEDKKNILVIASLILLSGIFNIYSLDIYNNKCVKLLLLVFILWGSTINIYLTILIAILLFVIYQMIINKQITEGFNPSNIDGNNYLENPLLTRDELERVDMIDLEPITPRQYNINLINQGKNLLNQVHSMQDDLKVNYDVREDNIMNITKRDAMVLINSGENGLDTSMGLYNSSLINKKFNFNNEYNKLLNDKTLTKEQFDEKLNNIYNNLNIQ
jgi:hypothetical protein